jgi:hypothetical protein
MSTSPGNQDWLSAILPLGRLDDERWTPIGACVLVTEGSLVWLLTAGSVLDHASGVHIGVLVGDGAQSSLFDLTAAQEGHGLSWLRHERLDLAATLFPVDPAWGVKAFSASTCLPARDACPLLTAATVVFPYEIVGPESRPPALVLDGVISGVSPDVLFSNAPVAPNCAGGPLLVVTAPPSLGGAVLLGGIVTGETTLREKSGMVPAALTAPSVRLSQAHPIDSALELIRSAAAQEQGKRVQGA